MYMSDGAGAELGFADLAVSEEVLTDQPEKPELVLPHADRVVTIMGVTGTIRSLFNLCPVDHNQMTQAQVDTYVEGLIVQSEEEEAETEVEEETEDETEPEAAEPKKKLY